MNRIHGSIQSSTTKKCTPLVWCVLDRQNTWTTDNSASIAERSIPWSEFVDESDQLWAGYLFSIWEFLHRGGIHFVILFLISLSWSKEIQPYSCSLANSVISARLGSSQALGLEVVCTKRYSLQIDLSAFNATRFGFRWSSSFVEEPPYSKTLLLRRCRHHLGKSFCTVAKRSEIDFALFTGIRFCLINDRILIYLRFWWRFLVSTSTDYPRYRSSLHVLHSGGLHAGYLITQHG